MQRLLKLSFIRNRLYAKAVDQFLSDQEAKGVFLRSEEVPEQLCGVRTVIIDAPLVMEGNNAVRRVAAPLEVCDLNRLRHQGAWMMLAAGVSLSCEGYAPLERFTQELGFARERMARQYPRVRVLPYDHARGMETTIHRDAGGLRAYAKGEPDALLARCTQVLNGKERPMTDDDRDQALHTAHEMERSGLHTLAFATRWQAEDTDDCERDMTFLGIVGTGDLPRANAPWAMEAMRGAGIRPVLVAPGDLTPGAIRASGVLLGGSGVMESPQIDRLSDVELRDEAQYADAYLGMDWTHKARLAKALRADGTVATLSSDPQGGLILALGNGDAPDVTLADSDIQAMVRLLGDCRALVESFSGA